MSVFYTENDASKTAEITVSGHVSAEEYRDVTDRLQAFIDRHDKIRLVEVIESFSGFDPSTIWDGFKFDMRNIPHISHVAVVSDIGWIGPLSKAAGAVVSTKLRTFDMAELEDARAWIQAA